MLHRMEVDRLSVAKITSDGCRLQNGSFSSRDPVLIQVTYLEYSKLILLPSVCHRLQNSIKKPFIINPRYTKMITIGRLASVYLRKPRCRDVLDAARPVRCPTRWASDHSLLKFLPDHKVIVFGGMTQNNANFDRSIDWRYKIFVLVPRFRKIFHLVREIKRDDARLSKV
jgi:hypothetical protein